MSLARTVAESNLVSFCAVGTPPQPWVEAFQAALPGYTVQAWQSGALLAQHAIVWSPPQAFFDEQTQLRAVFNLGAGVDALLALRMPEQALIVRLDDAGMSVQMAEFVCHAIVRHFRELDVYADSVKAGQWAYRKPRLRAEYPVGILGLGVLGTRVAQAVAQFEFPVNGWSKTPKSVDGVRCFCGDDELPAFLAASRYLVCLLPLTPQTQDILNMDRLSQLQSGGYLINVARGAHVVDADLLALLESGHLSGASLDVFRVEPLPVEHPFWHHPKITVTPHTSARTLREETIAQIARKIEQLSRGESVQGVVSRQKGY